MGRWISIVILAVAMLFGGGGCMTSATVVPPHVDGPTLPVYVADYGYHSSLVLPRSVGGLVEYAYGDWNYFANDNKSLGSALEALLNSKQATLGRRILVRSPYQDRLREALGAVSVIRFDAPADRVERLERELDERFASGVDSIMWSYPQNLYFVRDAERYSLTNNCNDLTARWLEELGCRVELGGGITSSKFKVAPAGDQVPGPSSLPPSPDSHGDAVIAGERR